MHLGRETMTKKREYTDLEVREIALSAQADARTVRRVIDGEDVRGVVKDRIRRAIDQRTTTGVVRGDVGAAGVKREA